MELTEPTRIMRPLVDPETVQTYVARDAARRERSGRLAEVEKLMRHHDALSLESTSRSGRRIAHSSADVSIAACRCLRQPKFYNVGKREAEPVSRAAAPADPTKMRRVRRNFGDAELYVY